MKRALVLGGGGSKGAYEVGVWKALREMGMKFDLVTGTSIGSMIGVMVVQDDYDKCHKLWSSLSVDHVIANGVNLDFDIELLMSQKHQYSTLLKSYINHKGADITPFIELIHDMFDEEKFFASDIDYACMTVNVSKLKEQAFTKEMMRNMDPRDAILASGSCFPAFPMKVIDGKRYIDGGYYDNVPIELARSLGADEIIAVDLKSVGHNRLKEPQSDTIYIEPFVPLGSFLLFDQKVIQRNMILGYNDCMKKFGKYLGYIYTFEKTDEKDLAAFESSYAQFLSEFNFTIKHQTIDHIYYSVLKHQLDTKMKEYEKFDNPNQRILGMCAYVYGLDDEPVYTFESFLNAFRQILNQYEPSYTLDDKLSYSELLEVLKKFSQKELIHYLANRLAQDNYEKDEDLKLLAIFFPDSYILAIMVYYAMHVGA